VCERERERVRLGGEGRRGEERGERERLRREERER
jgi:hypothetical protein